MKKLTNYFFVAIAALTMVFTSCSNDDEDPTGPIIEFLNGINEATVSSGGSYTLAGTITSETNLDFVKVFEVTPSGEVQRLLIEDFDDKNLWQFQIPIENIDADLTVKIEATDKDNISSSKNFFITVDATSGLKTWSATLYNALWYASADDKGAFFASASGEVFAQTGSGDVLSETEQGKTDFMYWYGSTSKASIVSPDNSTAAGLAGATKDWTTRNSTKIVVATGVTFADIDAAFLSALDLSSGISSASELSVGDIVLFETEGGKKGAIDIKAITGSAGDASDNITIDVKVQE